MVGVRLLAAGLVASISAERGLADEAIRMESTADRGPVAVRRIVSLDDSALRIRPAPGERGSDGERTIRREELISLDFSHAAPVSREVRGTALLFLTSGDRLQVLSVTSDEDALAVSLVASTATRLSIPLEQTRGLLHLERGRRKVDWLARLPVANGSSDIALLQNADRIRGEFVGLSEESLTMNTDKGETSVSAEDMKGLAFSPDLLSDRPSPARHSIVQFRDGSYLTVDTIRRGAGEIGWMVKVGEASWSFPDEAISRIAFYSESAASLLSLTPTDCRTVPFLPTEASDPPKPLAGAAATDSAAPPISSVGAPSVVQGRPIPRGLEAGGRTEWTYRLKPGWTELRAAANVPDSAGEGGSCVLRIEVDGKAVYASPILRASREAISIPTVPLGGASTLELVIDYGEFWDVRNRGVWIDPRLIRQPVATQKK